MLPLARRCRYDTRRYDDIVCHADIVMLPILQGSSGRAAIKSVADDMRAAATRYILRRC